MDIVEPDHAGALLGQASARPDLLMPVEFVLCSVIWNCVTGRWCCWPKYGPATFGAGRPYLANLAFDRCEITVRRSRVRQWFGEPKTEASRKPVPLHASVADELLR